ncbi:glutaredoxin domain-containing protein [Microbacteriaceae bacterium 4G12]
MKTVTVYTQPDCPPCKIVKQFLQHYDIPFAEYDIKKDSAARDRLVYDYHSYSTPTVVIDGEVVTGFNIEKLQQLLGLEA